MLKELKRRLRYSKRWDLILLLITKNIRKRISLVPIIPICEISKYSSKNTDSWHNIKLITWPRIYIDPNKVTLIKMIVKKWKETCMTRLNLLKSEFAVLLRWKRWTMESSPSMTYSSHSSLNSSKKRKILVICNSPLKTTSKSSILANQSRKTCLCQSMGLRIW